MISQTPLLNQKIFPGTDHQDASPLADNSQNSYDPLVKNKDKDTESLTFNNPKNKNNKRNLCLVKSISLQSLETISFLGSYRDANVLNDNNISNHISKKGSSTQISTTHTSWCQSLASLASTTEEDSTGQILHVKEKIVSSGKEVQTIQVNQDRDQNQLQDQDQKNNKNNNNNGRRFSHQLDSLVSNRFKRIRNLRNYTMKNLNLEKRRRRKKSLQNELTYSCHLELEGHSQFRGNENRRNFNFNLNSNLNKQILPDVLVGKQVINADANSVGNSTDSSNDSLKNEQHTNLNKITMKTGRPSNIFNRNSFKKLQFTSRISQKNQVPTNNFVVIPNLVTKDNKILTAANSIDFTKMRISAPVNIRRIPSKKDPQIPLRNSNNKYLSNSTKNSNITSMTTSSSSPSSSSSKNPSLSNWTPYQIASQLTLLDSKIFKQISSNELDKNLSWTRKDKFVTAPNVVAMTRRFNHTVLLVQREILNHKSIKERYNVIIFILKIMQELLKEEFRNYHAIVACISALQSVPIFRLTETWDKLRGRDKEYEVYQEFEKLTSIEENRRILRETMESDLDDVGNSGGLESLTSCIPFLGVYLNDIEHLQATSKLATSSVLENMMKTDNIKFSPTSLRKSSKSTTDLSLVFKELRNPNGNETQNNNSTLTSQIKPGLSAASPRIIRSQRFISNLRTANEKRKRIENCQPIINVNQRLSKIHQIIKNFQKVDYSHLQEDQDLQKYLLSFSYIEETRKVIEEGIFETSKKLEPGKKGGISRTGRNRMGTKGRLKIKENRQETSENANSNPNTNPSNPAHNGSFKRLLRQHTERGLGSRSRSYLSGAKEATKNRVIRSISRGTTRNLAGSFINFADKTIKPNFESSGKTTEKSAVTNFKKYRARSSCRPKTIKCVYGGQNTCTFSKENTSSLNKPQEPTIFTSYSSPGAKDPTNFNPPESKPKLDQNLPNIDQFKKVPIKSVSSNTDPLLDLTQGNQRTKSQIYLQNIETSSKLSVPGVLKITSTMNGDFTAKTVSRQTNNTTTNTLITPHTIATTRRSSSILQQKNIKNPYKLKLAACGQKQLTMRSNQNPEAADMSLSMNSPVSLTKFTRSNTVTQIDVSHPYTHTSTSTIDLRGFEILREKPNFERDLTMLYQNRQTQKEINKCKLGYKKSSSFSNFTGMIAGGIGDCRGPGNVQETQFV